MFNPQIQDALRGMTDRNWHVHTIFSRCASPEMTASNILRTADQLGLKLLALVDHSHPTEGSPLARARELRQQIDAMPHRVAVVVGAELSAFGVGRYGEDEATNQQVEYRLYACNHYHVKGWEHPAERTPQAYKDHMLAVLRQLIPSGRAGCIAHPFVGAYLSGYVESAASVTAALSDAELREILTLARKHRVALELSTRHLINDPAFARRYLTQGYEVGVQFRLGTDAHALRDLETKPAVERLIAALDS